MRKHVEAIPMAKLASRQVKLWEQTCSGQKTGDKTLAAIRPNITISKELGSGAVKLAQRLARRLGWQIFDKDLVEYIAREADVRTEMVETFDEKTQSEIHNWVINLLDRHALKTDVYFKHLVTVITTLGQSGHTIVVGRGGNFILPQKLSLRLKVVAPHELRLRNVAKELQISHKEAARKLSRTDEERAAFIVRFFRHMVDDPLDYDLVLNMGAIPQETAEEIILHALVAKFPGLKLAEATVCQTS